LWVSLTLFATVSLSWVQTWVSKLPNFMLFSCGLHEPLAAYYSGLQFCSLSQKFFLITLNGPSHGLWNFRVNPGFFFWLDYTNKPNRSP